MSFSFIRYLLTSLFSWQLSEAEITTAAAKAVANPHQAAGEDPQAPATFRLAPMIIGAASASSVRLPVNICVAFLARNSRNCQLVG